MNSGKLITTKVKIIILAAIGLILFCIGTIMGGSLSSITSIFVGDKLEAGAIELADCPADSVKSLELNLFNSDITFKTGKIFDVSGTGNYDSYVKDGVLYAGSSSRKYSVKILGMKLSIPSRWICGYASYVITIPKKSRLDNININTSLCNITGDSLCADNIRITNRLGNFSIDALTADNVDIETKGGSIAISKTQISQSGALSAFRNLSVGTNHAADSALQNITASSNWGNIQITGKMSGNSTLTSSHGDARLSLLGNSGNYLFDSPKDNLLVNTESGSSDSKKQYGNIAFQCKRGKISADFQ